ncbi:MAG: hypothetical protein WB952_12895 [Terriglobales bacterium]
MDFLPETCESLLFDCGTVQNPKLSAVNIAVEKKDNSFSFELRFISSASCEIGLNELLDWTLHRKMALTFFDQLFSVGPVDGRKVGSNKISQAEVGWVNGSTG